MSKQTDWLQISSCRRISVAMIVDTRWKGSEFGKGRSVDQRKRREHRCQRNS